MQGPLPIEGHSNTPAWQVLRKTLARQATTQACEHMPTPQLKQQTRSFCMYITCSGDLSTPHTLHTNSTRGIQTSTRKQQAHRQALLTQECSTHTSSECSIHRPVDRERACLELLLLGGSSECCCAGLACCDDLCKLVKVASAHKALVACSSVALLLCRKLCSLQLTVCSHAALGIVVGQGEHAVVQGVEASQGHKLQEGSD